MTITITLNDSQVKALTNLTNRHNKLMGRTLTVEQFVRMNMIEKLQGLVSEYRNRVKTQMEQNFDQLTPAEQQDILTRLGVEV